MAEGRFLGPVTLLREAEQLLPELAGLLRFDWEWRNWVDLLEASGRLVPVLRWRVPTAVMERLWANQIGREPEGEAASSSVATAVTALQQWDYARATWGKSEFEAQELHPLDAPPQGAEIFVESPTTVPWSPQTYEPAVIQHTDLGRTTSDDQGCVPIFRRWQVLLLVELACASQRQFHGVSRDSVGQSWPSAIFGQDTWSAPADLESFTQHRAALEALSWNAAYVHRAFQLMGKRPV